MVGFWALAVAELLWDSVLEIDFQIFNNNLERNVCSGGRWRFFWALGVADLLWDSVLLHNVFFEMDF